MEKISESSYKVLLSEETKQKLELYKQNIENGKVEPGSYFQEKLDGLNIQNLSSDEFLSLLVQTKKPQIYAESQVYGNGKDWNSSELSILGDINFAVPVLFMIMEFIEVITLSLINPLFKVSFYLFLVHCLEMIRE